MYQAEGNLLEDEELIDTLAASKKTSIEIGAKLEEAVATEKTLDAVRVLYAPVAQRFLFIYLQIYSRNLSEVAVLINNCFNVAQN
jgi:dynein heavy chain